MSDISHIRKTYSLKQLTEADVHKDPIQQFEIWWQEAVDSKIEEVNAMTLATASSDGIPSARIVLLKGFSKDGFKFYSNYRSYKGKQLLENPKACLVFFWKELERQVRITGLVEKTSSKDSDDYFASRPLASQVGAAVSPQSNIIDDRTELEQNFSVAKLEADANNGIKRPEHWGGYILKPVMIEFWQGRRSRLHDRIEYSLNEDGSWLWVRLAP